MKEEKFQKEFSEWNAKNDKYLDSIQSKTGWTKEAVKNFFGTQLPDLTYLSIGENAPAGHEGGNTRYCGQLIAGTKSKEAYKKYYSQLTAPFKLDQKIVDTFVDGVANMSKYLEKYLHVEPFSFLDHPERNTVKAVKGDFPDYPEYEGADQYNMFTVHDGESIEDGALWKALRNEVMKRLDQITIWYSSPATHLLQNNKGRVIGTVINRHGQDIYVHANKGIILTAGGFENDPERIQNYLGVPKIVPMGSLYNKGDSVKLSIEVGADQWHTSVYNAGGLYHGLTYAVPEGQRGPLVFTWPQLYTGSIFVVGNDGTRYFPEDQHSKAGYLFIHGFGRHPHLTTKSWIIFDQKQKAELDKIADPIMQKAIKNSVFGDSVDDIASKLGFDKDVFANTVNEFNELATLGKDYQYGRNGESLAKIDGSKLYAIELQASILNTQGGPRRNEKAQILRPDGSWIEGLFGAGEAGSITTNQYQAGQDVAELLIFGKIAGENIAKIPSDVAVETPTEYNLDPNQYIGESSEGMGNSLVVKVSVDSDNKKITKIEVLEQSETEEIGQKVIQPMIKKIIDANSTEVDVVSGASLTSKAVKDAVRNAISNM